MTPFLSRVAPDGRKAPSALRLLMPRRRGTKPTSTLPLPILQRLGQVLAADVFAFFEIGQGARHLEQAVGRAQRQTQAFAGLFQPEAVFIRQHTMPAQSRQVEKGVGAALSGLLARPCTGHLVGRLRGALRCGFGGRELGGFARHRDMQVDAVEQRAGQLVAVALHLFRGAAAAAGGITQVAARAGVHGGNQLEARRKTQLFRGAGNDDFAAFQWLAQHLQHLAVEFGQLIEEQHTLVGEGDFARTRPAATVGLRNSRETIRLGAYKRRS